MWRRNALVVRRGADGVVVAAVRDSFAKRDRLVIQPPAGYRISPYTQPAITQDGSRAVVDLIDREGDRDLGVLNTRTGELTILDHAWEPVASPAPTVVGPLGAQRAAFSVDDLLGSTWDASKADLLAGDQLARLFPRRIQGFIRNEPTQVERGWSVVTTAYGRDRSRDFIYRSFDIEIAADHGRISAQLQPLTPIVRVNTIEDAMGFVRAALDIDVPSPGGLPAGSFLVDRWGLQGNSWNANGSFAQLGIRLPGSPRWSDITYSFGPGVMFMEGCGDGGGGKAKEIDIAGTTGLIDHMPGTTQIIWPATNGHESDALYGVSASLGKAEVIALAEAMEANR
jgi:hypothetical protein